jgi:hypothetical protein
MEEAYMVLRQILHLRFGGRKVMSLFPQRQTGNLCIKKKRKKNSKNNNNNNNNERET